MEIMKNCSLLVLLIIEEARRLMRVYSVGISSTPNRLFELPPHRSFPSRASTFVRSLLNLRLLIRRFFERNLFRVKNQKQDEGK